MRRKYIIIIFLLVISFLFYKSFNKKTNDNILLGDDGSIIGDINRDGKVNSGDYILVRKYILSLISFTDFEKKLADMNNDSKVTSNDYILMRKYIIKDPESVEVSEIALNQSTLSMDGGDTKNLVAIISPSNVINRNVTWSSDNNRVAMVDSNGKITANTSGTANITATTDNGKTASCKVTVTVNITYKEIRYEQENGLATTIWYAIIPKKYKMHYAYADDTIRSFDKPSNMAKKVNATLAVNAQLLGFPIVDGKEVDYGDNVAGYDFIVKKNPNFKFLDVNTPPWTALTVTATKDFSQGISFKDINLGFDYDGNSINCKGKTLWMSLFNQLVMNGKDIDNYIPVPKDSEYFKKYYNTQNTYHYDRDPDTWIAYDSKGNQLVALCSGRNIPLRDGTQSKEAGLNFPEIIKVTRELLNNDVTTLYILDGGGSSSFVYKGNKLNGDYDTDKETGEHIERGVTGIFYW